MPLLPSAVLGIQHPHRWQGDKELFENLPVQLWPWKKAGRRYSLHAMFAQILAEALSGKLAAS